jgi:hypothetical protein
MLDEGLEDERLVCEAHEGPGRAKLVDPPLLATEVTGRRSGAAA